MANKSREPHKMTMAMGRFLGSVSGLRSTKGTLTRATLIKKRCSYKRGNPQVFQRVNPYELPGWFGYFQSENRCIAQRWCDHQRKEANESERADSSPSQVGRVLSEFLLFGCCPFHLVFDDSLWYFT